MFARVISLSGLSLPSFWLGLLVLTAFVNWFGWIPIYTDKPETLWQELGLLSIPAAAVGFRASALIMRLTRSSMLEVMRQDYIRTARAKGASEQTVNYDHALRNAVLPGDHDYRDRGGFPDRRPHCNGNGFQHSRRRPLPG